MSTKEKLHNPNELIQSENEQPYILDKEYIVDEREKLHNLIEDDIEKQLNSFIKKEEILKKNLRILDILSLAYFKSLTLNILNLALYLAKVHLRLITKI